MSKLNSSDWKVIIKVIIAIATTILGAMGAGQMGDEKWPTPNADAGATHSVAAIVDSGSYQLYNGYVLTHMAIS